jgi:polar amino acid transport system ATP-binding protein
MLSVNKVSKRHGDLTVLKEISFELEKNKIIGLAGPSGSGKSTLLRCIQKLESVDAGTIVCDEATGFMFQDFQLFPHMTVYHNLIYAPQLNKRLFTGNSAGNFVEKNAGDLLKKLGLTHKADVYPNQLSGGQKQRVALARSLMMQPSLLLCDEPTSGLDVATILDVIELLQSVKEMGITMILASHDLDFLTQIADKIILLKDGKIAIEVDPKTMSNPIDILHEYY